MKKYKIVVEKTLILQGYKYHVGDYITFHLRGKRLNGCLVSIDEENNTIVVRNTENGAETKYNLDDMDLPDFGGYK
ncbi:MAG: hypothetical protein MJ244_04130 [Clostridia bacterium]|nr:hypothetical protein [Clostridia bacterium]